MIFSSNHDVYYPVRDIKVTCMFTLYNNYSIYFDLVRLFRTLCGTQNRVVKNNSKNSPFVANLNANMMLSYDNVHDLRKNR